MMGTSSPNGNRTPPERTECQGWSAGATRRNRQWLYSVNARKLTGIPIAITLTVKECPPTHDEWKRLREALFVRLRRKGLLRLHWVTEWTRRGLPHLHAAAYFDAHDDADTIERLTHQIRTDWLELTAHLGTKYRAQHVMHIYEASGWFQYVAKHASRGVKHYQRQQGALPPGWKRTGRVWGHLGDWPTVEATLVIDEAGGFRLRRMIRGWLVANVRTRREVMIAGSPNLIQIPRCSQSGKQIGWLWADVRYGSDPKTFQAHKWIKALHRELRFSRRLLACNNPHRSPLVGLSQWVPYPVMAAFLDRLVQEGHEVSS